MYCPAKQIFRQMRFTRFSVKRDAGDPGKRYLSGTIYTFDKSLRQYILKPRYSGMSHEFNRFSSNPRVPFPGKSI